MVFIKNTAAKKNAQLTSLFLRAYWSVHWSDRDLSKKQGSALQVRPMQPHVYHDDDLVGSCRPQVIVCCLSFQSLCFLLRIFPYIDVGTFNGVEAKPATRPPPSCECY